MRRLRPRPSLFVLWLTLLLLAATWVGLGSGPASLNGFAQSAAVPPYLPSDPLLASPRGSVDQTLQIAQIGGALRFPEVQAYVTEVFRLAPLVGLDPAVVIAQSAVETGLWTTQNWGDHLNPAGIGITSPTAPSFTWENGTDAARGQIVHLYVYAVGAIPTGHVLEPYIPLDPRYQAAIGAGYAGIAETVDDLSGRWAVDTSYGQKIAGRANDIYLRTRPTNYGASSGAPNSALADDGKTTTTWTTPAGSSPPANAYALYDLGGVKPVGSIRWVMGVTGFADQMLIQVSSNLSSWTTIATVGNSPVGAWQELRTFANGRYVRFFFNNPNGDLQLGGIAEVHFWPPTTATIPWQFPVTPVATPAPTEPASIALSYSRGTVASFVGTTIRGYSPGQTVQIIWKSTFLTNVVMDQNGTGFVNLKIPAMPAGTYTVQVVGGTRTASTTFTIAPRIQVIPSQAARGTTVNISLRGFGKKETVRIRWVQGGRWVEVATATMSNTGSANVHIPVPSWVPDGATKVRGDGTINRAQTNGFTVSGGAFVASDAGTPAATATVTATPEGTPGSDGSPVVVAETSTVVIEPTLEPTVVIEPATAEPTATEEPTPADEASPSVADGTPEGG